MNGPPRIGITTALVDGEMRLDLRYVREVERAGGIPVPVPPLEDAGVAAELASMLDGLVVIGGPGVTEGLIGELPAELAPVAAERWDSDTRLLRAFLDSGRPVLGICYGMQLANALRGGTIWGDVERQVPDALVHSDKRGGHEHAIRVLPGTHLRHLVGTDALRVPTHHLQALHSLGSGFLVSALAPDGVIEAMETVDGAFLGVQFHPERMGDEATPLFRHIVRRAADRGAGGAAA